MSQLALLTAAYEAPPSYPCPTCRGEGECLRLLYPGERDPGGPFVAMKRCPTCRGEKRVPWDPKDLTEVPF